MAPILLVFCLFILGSVTLYAQSTVVNSLILKGNDGYRLTLTAPAGLTGNVTIPMPSIPAGGTLLGTDATGNLVLGAGNYIQLTEPAGAGGTNWTRLQAGPQAANVTLTMPTAAPTVNQVLTATAVTVGGDVTLGWTTPSVGGGGGGVSVSTTNLGGGTIGNAGYTTIGGAVAVTSSNKYIVIVRVASEKAGSNYTMELLGDGNFLNGHGTFGQPPTGGGVASYMTFTTYVTGVSSLSVRGTCFADRDIDNVFVDVITLP